MALVLTVWLRLSVQNTWPPSTATPVGAFSPPIRMVSAPTPLALNGAYRIAPPVLDPVAVVQYTPVLSTATPPTPPCPWTNAVRVASVKEYRLTVPSPKSAQ